MTQTQCLSLTLVLILIPLIAPTAYGHGGSYRGPTVPPPPWVPPAAVPPGTKGGRTALPGRNPRAMTPTLDVRLWETWWGYNKDEFLPKRGHAVGQPGEAGYDALRRRPSEEEIRETILPALLELLKNGRDKDIRNSAALAIGRIGDVREYKLLNDLLGDKERTVVEAAVLGLGMLRAGRAEKRLVEIASDPTQSAKIRGLAVLGLGYSAGEIARKTLVEGLGVPTARGFSRRGRAAHLESLRAIAAGLLDKNDLNPLGERGTAEATGHLVNAIRSTRTKERTFLPYAYVALSKTRDPSALRTVLTGLGNSKGDIRAGAAIALGRVLQNPDKKLIKKIARMLDNEGDIFVRRMLLISLGRVGGPNVKPYLVRALDHKDRQHRAFAALACAIAGYGDLVDRFRKSLLSSRDASMKGAFAVALGILGDRDGGVKRILHVLERDRNPDVRAHLVEALTVLESRDSVPAIEKLLVDSRSPALSGACGQALGLLGGAAVRDVLIAALVSRSTSLSSKGGIASGIGRMGDSRAIAPLVQLARNESAQDIERAFAVTALGILAEKNPGIPPFSRVTIDAHYELRTDALEELRWLF